VPKAARRRILRKKDEETMKTSGRFALSVMAVVTILFSGAAQATIYRWQDAEGNTHFTDDLTRVPAPYRGQVEVEALPEAPVSATPAPPPPVDEPPDNPPPPAANEYEECLKKVQEERERLTRQLEEDEDRLVELNRAIRRSTTSRKKNAYQRERAAVKQRIAKVEQMLTETLPPMERECEVIRYWQGEE
jgi:type IV secretory pathway VirB10-like protein